MRKCLSILFVIILLLVHIQPVSADTFTPPEVPESGSAYMPDHPTSFGEGLWYIIKTAILAIKPSLAEAVGLCSTIIALSMLTTLLNGISSKTERILQIAFTVGLGVLLLQTTTTLVNKGCNTVLTISEYGKLLIPVMTAVLAAQGSMTASTALYSGTILFATFLTNLITKLIIPMIYFFLCLAIGNSAVGENTLNKMQNLIKWLITWILKTVLYIFTGYISITGVVSGTADVSMIKATKLTISGTVPVVGSILSDASESILVSAGIMKNTVGIYGVLAIAATFIYPFLQIGVQYLLLKFTAAICSIWSGKSLTGLLQGFTTAMGFILAIIGAISLLLFISLVCMLKGGI